MKSGLALSAVVGGVAAVLNPRGPDAAGQIRLAYHGQDGMTVSWNTFEHVNGPRVRWGLSKDNLNNTAKSDVSVTYPTSTTYNNHVVVQGLKPDTTYYYLPSPLPQGNHEPYTFRTARAVGSSQEYSVAVAIDMGTMGRLGLSDKAGAGVAKENILKPGEKNTIDSLAATKDSWDFVLHPGDIAYADYWLKEEIGGYLPNTTIAEGHTVYEAILNDFYDELTVVTETKPYMIGPGNHEANCLNGGVTDKAKNITYDIGICSPGQTNFTGFKNHWRMPGDVSGGTGNFWYSFDHGMAHFISLDMETDTGHGYLGPDEIGAPDGQGASPVNATRDAQSKWLEEDLKNVDRTKTPWVIVSGHRPFYLSKKREAGTFCLGCIDVFEPLFIKYGVDLYLSGHAHVYERMAPIAQGKIDAAELNNPKAPWYITNGAAGHYNGLDDLLPKREAYSRFALDIYNATYGWSKLTFHNCTHLTHEYVASNNNSVLDTATLFKDRKCSLTSGTGSTHGSGSNPGNSTTGGNPPAPSTHNPGTSVSVTPCATVPGATGSSSATGKGPSGSSSSSAAASPKGPSSTPSGSSPAGGNPPHNTPPTTSSGSVVAASMSVVALVGLLAFL